MEILRFDNSELKPAQRKSSRGMLVAGLLATLFGISSAFASSTITINGSAPIALGQGVSFVTGCDNTITMTPRTSMTVKGSTPTFFLNSIQISDVDTRTAGADGIGCAGKTLDVQIFHGSSTVAYNCTELNLTAPFNVTYVDGGTMSLSGSCSSGTVSFTLPIAVEVGNPTFEIPFVEAPSEITYLTLVSRNA